MDNNDPSLCAQHSGMIVKLEDHEHRIESVEACVKDLKDKVDSMKNWLIRTLTAVIVTLVAVLVNIIISLGR